MTPREAKVVMSVLEQLANPEDCKKYLQAFPEQVEKLLPAHGTGGKMINTLDDLVTQLSEDFGFLLTAENYSAFNFHDIEIELIQHSCKTKGLVWKNVNWEKMGDVKADLQESNLPGGRHWLNIKAIRDCASQFREGGLKR